PRAWGAGTGRRGGGVRSPGSAPPPRWTSWSPTPASRRPTPPGSPMPESRLSPPERDPAGPVDLLVIGDCNPDVMVVGGDVTPAFGQQEKLVDGISLEIGGPPSIPAAA